MQPAVFLDRDNTLIANDGDLGDPEQVRLVDGVAHGLRALREAGFRLVVVTNQAGVARGKFSEEQVDAVNQRIATLAEQQAGARGLVDRFYYCPYHPDASVPEYRRDHPWRKPHPGMILQAARDMGLDLSRSWMIGDQERDILAGKAAGCRTVLFSRDADLAMRVRPAEVAATFGDAVAAVLRHRAELNRASSAAPQPPPSPAAAAAASASGGGHGAAPAAPPGAQANLDAAGMRRAIVELAEEIRSDRLRRSEFRFVTMAAGLCQLLAITLGLLGLLQLDHFEVYARWLIGALLMQGLALTLLVLDLKG